MAPSGQRYLQNGLQIDENTETAVRYIIDKSLKWRIRDMLDQLNVNERMTFPGLDGLTAWLNRHYYVK